MTSLIDPRAWLGRHVAGRHRVVRELSRGGMGVVFLAVQEPLEREIALKIMLPGAAADEASRRRFIHEAQALSRIPHQNIVTIFDFGEAGDGSLFIAMELVSGLNLRDVLHGSGTLGWTDTLPVVVGIARALAVAHASGILHRDLKPENVMLVQGRCTSDDVKLLDFGLARALGGTDHLTQVNAIPGTPNYIAPERVVSRTEDPRSDLYALGAIWFELLTGRPLFLGETMAAILLAQVQQPVPTIASVHPGAGVPDEVEALIMRLLAKRPEERWPDVPAFLEELVIVGEQLLGAGFAAQGSRHSSARLPRPPLPTPTAALAPASPPASLASPPPPSTPPGASRWTTRPSGLIAAPTASATPAARVRFRADDTGPTPTSPPPPPPTPTMTAPSSHPSPVLPGKTALFSVGADQLTVQSEWLSARSVIECAAFFRGRVLRRHESFLDRDTPLDEARRRLDDVHQTFVDAVHARLKKAIVADPDLASAPADPPSSSPSPSPSPASVSEIFFAAVASWQSGDGAGAMALLREIDVDGADPRVGLSRQKLALFLTEPPG